MDLKEFRKSILNLNSSRKHKVTGSIGVYQIYKFIRKNKWFNIGQPVTEHQFYTIIRSINDALSEELINGNDVKLPHRLGRIEIRKYDTYVKIDNAKIKSNHPIDWDSTLKLWHENQEAHEKKILIRTEGKEVFKIYYNKGEANYTNKSFIEFSPNRTIKRTLKDNIKDNKIDAYELGRVAL